MIYHGALRRGVRAAGTEAAAADAVSARVCFCLTPGECSAAVNYNYRVSFTLKQHTWQRQWERHKLLGEGASFQLGAIFFLLMKDLLHNLHLSLWFAAAAAKSLQSCPTLCDPMDGSPPGSSIHGICPARVLEWVATAFSVWFANVCK